MAPSRIVTVVAASAILLGVAFMVYLIQRRKRQRKDEDESASSKTPVSESAEDDRSQNASESEDIVLIKSDIVASMEGQPMDPAMQESLAVSGSWAILNGNTDSNSPHLSPISSEGSMGRGEEESDSVIQRQDIEMSGYESISSDITESTVLAAVEKETILAEPEEVSSEDLAVKYQELLREHARTETHQWTQAEITDTLIAAQNPVAGLKPKNAEILVDLINHKDQNLKMTVVQGIARSAVFTHNQNLLRDHGCLPKLSKLLELQRMAMWLRHSNAASSLSPTINAINNLAMNEQNNKELEACVPTLVDISLDKDTGESVCLSSLQALTNLSVTSDHHGYYTRLVSRLYELFGEQDTRLQLQALKILINLSCNPDMVPHLLAAKAPDKLLDLLNTSITDEAVILRFVTFLANVLQLVKEKHITSSSLPTDDKAPSPETMYSALLGLSNVGNLKNKMFLLCKHENDDIRTQAARVHGQLK